MITVDANYYDGQTARQQAVTLSIKDDVLQMDSGVLLREIPLSQIKISSKLGNTPRLLNFSDGGHCEVKNHAAFETMLHEAHLQPQSRLFLLESKWRHALTATLLAFAFVIASYYWGLPWFAKLAAEHIPASVSLSIDTHVLQAIDENMMQPSKLNLSRQHAIQQRFNGMHRAEGAVASHLQFRNSMKIGANAFALPGGTIIVTDQLVALAGNEEEILAVLSHELGHVSERHPLRQLLQSSVIGLAMTWYLGDISTLLAAAPTLLLESSYSRNFERRADQYAANMLRLNHIAPARLADILEKLETAHAGKKEKEATPSRLAELFSTHPDTAERIRELRSNFIN